MSILTIEERTLLKSMDCRDKKQAIEVLDVLKMELPVRSELFLTAVSLAYKLENERVDYAFEMSGESAEDKNI